MSGEALALITRLFKAAIFVPTIALVGWWVFANWLDRTLSLEEAVVAGGILAVAFLLGVASIVAGGWGFLAVLAFIYLAVVALVVWEYTYWRRRERDHYLSEIEKYTEAIDLDPTNAAAYSFLGECALKLGRFEEAEAALEEALKLDPNSKRDRRLIRYARERRQVHWRRLD